MPTHNISSLHFFCSLVILNCFVFCLATIFRRTNENFQSTITVPRKIFQTWKTMDLPETCKFFQKSILSKNKSFSYVLYDDTMVDNFMKSLSWYNFYKKLPHRIQQIDFFRYCLLYVHGGVYFDIDVECVVSLEPNWNSIPVDKITVGEEYKWTYDDFKSIYPDFESITGTTFEKNTIIPFLGNYAFICSEKSKPMKRFIEFLISKYNQRSKDLEYRLTKDKFIFYTTGPYILTEYYYQQQDDFHILPRKENNQFQFGDYGIHHSVQSWLNSI